MTQGCDDDGVPLSCGQVEKERDGAIAHWLLRDVALRQDIDAKLPLTSTTAQEQAFGVIVGVYFSLPDEETVWLGHFGGPHEAMPAAQAAGKVMHAPDGLGLKIIVPRAIRPRDIRSIRPLRHVIGWRYKPGAHGEEPCGCPRCQRGAIKSRKLQARYERWNDAYRKAPFLDLLKQLRDASDACRTDLTNDEADYKTCDILGEIRFRKAGVVSDLAFLIDHPNDDVVQCLAATLGRYREPAARAMLITLCQHASGDVRESAADSLLDLYKGDALNLLAPLLPDEAIARAIAELSG